MSAPFLDDPDRIAAFEEAEDPQAVDVRNYVEDLTGKPQYTPVLVNQWTAWIEGYGPEPCFAWMFHCDTRGPTDWNIAADNAELRVESLQ